MENNILATSLTLPNGTVIKNRIFKSAMSEAQGTADHAPSTSLVKLYERWAEGGVGLSVTGNVMIDRRALGESGNVVVEDERDLVLLSEWAAAGTKNGTHLWMQLNHPGKQSPKFISKEPVAPSAIPLSGKLARFFSTPRALTQAEIKDVIKRFGNSARIAKKAGFTGVQIHGAHGYLVSQFLSPHHNQREDEWGGSLENRMRFVLEVYKEIRQQVGEDFPIGIKLNSADFQRGGFTEEESMIVVQKLSEAGMDLIEISGGTYERPAMMGPPKKESTRKREAYFLHYAEKVRKLVGTPLVVTGGFRTRAGMMDALTEDGIDMIGVARPFAIYPDLPHGLLNGELEEITMPPITTGVAALDKRIPLIEMSWYGQQLSRMGRGKNPKANLSAWSTILHVLWKQGTHGFKKRRG